MRCRARCQRSGRERCTHRPFPWAHRAFDTIRGRRGDQHGRRRRIRPHPTDSPPRARTPARRYGLRGRRESTRPHPMDSPARAGT
eukprot:scaffold68654_cov69-Phaeocystis_antarctica.AAC.4